MTSGGGADDPVVRIALDTVRAGRPDPDVVRGALLAAAADPGLGLVLVGPRTAVAETVAAADVDVPADRVRIADAPHAVAADDDPVVAVRARQDASVRVALAALAEGAADAAVSAGPVAATVTATRFAVGRRPGVRAPALAVQVSGPAGRLLVADAGASPDAPAGAVVRYGELGARLAAARGVAAPTVAALQPLGTSTRVAEELAMLFAAADLGPGTYVGPRSAGAALAGDVDVLVTTGAAGHLLVDTLAAVAGGVDPHGVLLGPRGLVATLAPASAEATAAAVADVAALVPVTAEVAT